MNSSEINTANNFSSNNLRNNRIMNGGPLVPPVVDAVGAEETEKLSEKIRINENLASATSKPKNTDEFLNLEEIDISTRTRVNILNDNPDSRNKFKKPTNYASKKAVAQGMIDIALITSNANQLKNLVEYQQASTFYFLILFLILVSLLLQISVGVSLIFMGRFDTKRKDRAAALRVNNWIMSGVFIITVINVFIAVFSTGPNTIQNPATASTPPSA